MLSADFVDVLLVLQCLQQGIVYDFQCTKFLFSKNILWMLQPLFC